MTLKDTINGVVKPNVYYEGNKTGLSISEDVAGKSERAAMPKSRSRIENVQSNDLDIEISQRDIDKAAKKYHKEMRNRRRQQNGGNETAQLQHGFLPVLTQVLFNEIQEHQQEVKQEVKQEMRPRSRLRSHLKNPKHRRPQMANNEHGHRRERPQERENQAAQESSLRRLKHLKKHPEGFLGHLEDYESLSHQPFRTQELLQEASHIRLGNPTQLRQQDEQAQIANDELSHRTRRRQKHPIRQHTSLENAELSLETEENSPRQRHHKHTRQHQQSLETSPDASSRQRNQRNHRRVQDPQGEPPRSSEIVSISRTRHNRQRLPQADQVQVWGESQETPSRQRRQRHLAQQHGPPENPARSHVTDSESRLRHIVQQQSQVPDEGHFASHQGRNSGRMQTHLRSPISNDVINEELRASQRKPRSHNSPRILHPCDRPSSSEDTPQSTPSQEDHPPSDEYYAGNEAEIPPYHATLHKYLDLISYDPRVVPCLRVNRSLIRSNDKLTESIFQFLKFNLFPESIDPWEISHIDDQHYDDLIPDLISVETDSSDVLPNIPYESHYRHHNNMVPQIISDDDYEYALYLSTLENNVHNYATGIGSIVRG